MVKSITPLRAGRPDTEQRIYRRPVSTPEVKQYPYSYTAELTLTGGSGASSSIQVRPTIEEGWRLLIKKVIVSANQNVLLETYCVVYPPSYCFLLGYGYQTVILPVYPGFPLEGGYYEIIIKKFIDADVDCYISVLGLYELKG